MIPPAAPVKRLPLGSLGSYIRGITFKPTDKLIESDEGAVACMRTANIQKELDESNLIYVGPQHVKRDEQYVREGDILISASNSWNLVGKCVRVSVLSYKATAGGFISIFRPNPNIVDPSYLFRWLSSSATQQKVRDCARQTTNIANLNTNLFKALEVPLPPLSHQRGLGVVLDGVDTGRTKQHLALARLDVFLAAVFDEMFGDPVTNPKGWPEAAFVSLFRERSAGNARIDTRDYLAEGPVRVVDQGEALVSGFAGDPALIADVPLPVIVFGDHTRRFKLIDFPFAVGAQGTKLLAPSARLDPTFAYHQLRVLPLPATGYARHYKFLKTKTLIVPPLPEQERFAEVVRRSEPLRERLVASGARLDALYASLAARAFRGDLRLASDTPTD